MVSWSENVQESDWRDGKHYLSSGTGSLAFAGFVDYLRNLRFRSVYREEGVSAPRLK